jgi:adenylate cyclase
MHDSLERIVQRARRPAATFAHAVPCWLQVALAHGEVVEMSGDCFGDAVNVAARLLDHAGDNETLITARCLAGLPMPRKRAFAVSTACSCAAASSRSTCYLLEGCAASGDTPPPQFGDPCARPSPRASA